MAEEKKTELVKMDLSSKSISSKSEEKPKAEIKPKVKARVKKETPVQKLYGVFFSKPIKYVVKDVFMDIIVPDLKDLFFDAGNDLWAKFIYPDDEKASRRGRSRRSPSRDRRRDYTEYNNRYGRTYGRKRTNTRTGERNPSRPQRTKEMSHRDFVYDSRSDAEEVLGALTDAIDDYDCVTVANVYEEAGFAEYVLPIHNRYGWFDLANAEVIHTRDGWKIAFPSTEEI